MAHALRPALISAIRSSAFCTRGTRFYDQGLHLAHFGTPAAKRFRCSLVPIPAVGKFRRAQPLILEMVPPPNAANLPRPPGRRER